MSRDPSEPGNSHRPELLIDLSFLLLLAFFFVGYLPLDLLRSSPASGGDLGSHFWPVMTLLEYGIPQADFPVWNPGNNGGEAQLLHYFPLPFFIITGLCIFFPPGMAFNFGVLLPLLLLPGAAYLCARCMGFRFPAPLLAACAAQTFALNESYKIWGGNALSTLAGQFAHQYAFLFFVLASGALCYELRRRKNVFLSAFLFASVVTSHPYVALALPFLAAGVVWGFPAGTRRERMKHVSRLALWSMLLSLWFLVPLLDNQKWTSPLSMVWDRNGLWVKIVPLLFVPWILLGCLGLGLCLLRYRERKRVALLQFFALLTCALGVFYGVGFFVFPHFGLVDVRALPQIQLITLLLSAVALGEVLTIFGKAYKRFGGIALAAGSMLWLSASVVQLPAWSAWNFSGWESKKAHRFLEKLYASVRGDFNDLRILYEHSPLNHFAGSVRVFEMLPYFSGRATLESVYTQSTILSRSIYLLQSEVSKSPSCPFSLSPCHSRDVGKAIDKMKLLGVGSFIAIEPSTVAEAMKVPELQLRDRFGPWRLFDLREPSSYVGHLKEEPRIVEEENWRGLFETWFENYSKGKAFLVAAKTMSPATREMFGEPDNSRLLAPADCTTGVKVHFSGITLDTTCPGYLHYLAFAYHPSWRANSGDAVFAVSPGFVGIIPSEERVLLAFGESLLWRCAQYVSILSCALFFLLKLYHVVSQGSRHSGEVTPERNGPA